MKNKSLLARFLIWRLKHITDRQFISFLGVLIGITSGLAAVVIKYCVHVISSLLQGTTELESVHLLYMVYPAIGISVTLLFIKYVIKKPVSHGIPNVLYSISKTNAHIDGHNMFSSIVTSAFTVGFGVLFYRTNVSSAGDSRRGASRSTSLERRSRLASDAADV